MRKVNMKLRLPSKPVDRYTITVYRVDLSSLIPSLRTVRYIYYEQTRWEDHPWGRESPIHAGAPFVDDWTVEVKWNPDDTQFCGEGRLSGWSRLVEYLDSDTCVFGSRQEAKEFMVQATEIRIQRRQEEIDRRQEEIDRRQEEIEELKAKRREIGGR